MPTFALEYKPFIHKIKKPEHDSLLKKLANDFCVRIDDKGNKNITSWCNEYDPRMNFIKERVKWEDRPEDSVAYSKRYALVEDGKETVLKRIDGPIPKSAVGEKFTQYIKPVENPADFFDIALKNVHGRLHKGAMLVLIDKKKLKEKGYKPMLPDLGSLVSYPEERVISNTEPVNGRPKEIELPKEVYETFEVDDDILNSPITPEEISAAKDYLLRELDVSRDTAEELAIKHVLPSGDVHPEIVYSLRAIDEQIERIEKNHPEVQDVLQEQVRAMRMYKQLYEKIIDFAKKKYANQ